mmetsp:Transcript_32988/g.50488  ORF Transcript_32988/g.50488 Transcript_32988/m.50488 type:complete len:80 (+) Transcript_32988:927-1166(+)
MDLQPTIRDGQNPPLANQGSEFLQSNASKKDSIKDIKSAMHRFNRQESNKKKRNAVMRKRKKLMEQLSHLGEGITKQDI